LQKTCLFCGAINPRSIEHIIPESLGNDDLILTDDVCRSCNNYFAKIEKFVLGKTDLAFWRAFLGIRSKKGKLPSVDLSLPKKFKGVFPSTHSRHSDEIGFTAHEDGSISVENFDETIIREILSGERRQFQFVMTPNILHQFGRFLCKIGVELVCRVDPRQARSERFQAARVYARHGSTVELWPIFHFSSGDIRSLRRLNDDGTEDVDCYSYSLIEVGKRYTLSLLKVGTNNWVTCLNEQWPTPEIRRAFPEFELQMIWYPKESFR
jgi:hypothetical protein